MIQTLINSRIDSLPLGVLVYSPDSAPKALVQIVHGMCEHKERYIPLMNYLASRGYASVIHDHRGHGQSVLDGQDLGYMYKGGWKAMVEDILTVQEYFRSLFPPELKLTLLGHSMGSMAVRAFTRRYDSSIDSLIVCGSPSYNPALWAGRALASLMKVFKGDRYRSRLMQKLIFGSYNRPFESEGYSSAWVCSDQDVLKEYHEDPLCHFTFTLNGFGNLLALMQYCYRSKEWKMGNPDLEVHFISGAVDPCMGSRKMFSRASELFVRAGYNKVSLKLYPSMRHEILNEKGKQEVWEDLLEYIAKDSER